MGDHVKLGLAAGFDQRLGNHHAQHRARKVLLLVTAIDRDLAGARLDPDAGDGFLAAAGAVSTALSVDFRFNEGLRSGGDGFVTSHGAEVLEGVCSVGHNDQAVLTFLRFIDAKSTLSGLWAVCGCSAPA